MITPHFTFRPKAVGALTAAAAAALAAAALVGCTPGTASSSGATSGQAPAGSGSAAVSYLPGHVGDTWAYNATADGKSMTIRNRTVALTPVSGGTAVTLTQTTVVGGKQSSLTVQEIAYSDGRIGIPVSLGGLGLNAKGTYWPSPAQLASGQPVNETPTASMTVGGKTIPVREHLVMKGDGTQTVTVPAGTYTATVLDEEATDNILGDTATVQTKFWLVNGIGPVKEQQTSRYVSGTFTSNQELASFTKG
jgi:hypothetical protein